MNSIRSIASVLTILCIGTHAYAQYDDTDNTFEEWSLEEEAATKPLHKEYKQTLYLQYSPSQYLLPDAPHRHFQEFGIGYSRAIQVMEENPYFVEVGANMKYSFAKYANGTSKNHLLTFRLPINALYKLYLSPKNDQALVPFAGVYCRCIAVGKEKTGTTRKDLFDNGWKRIQLGWQAGIRYQFDRFYLGVSYSRDFPDENKRPAVHECSLLMGVGF